MQHGMGKRARASLVASLGGGPLGPAALGLAALGLLGLGAAPAAAAGPAADFFADVAKPLAPDAPLDFPRDRVPGRVLLKVAAEPGTPAAQQALDAIAAHTGIQLTLVRPSILGWGLYDIEDAAKPGRPDEAHTLVLVEALRDEPEVTDVSDDRWYRTLAVPNDPGFEDMWHLDVIGAPTAWDTTRGVTTQRIGVVDTGTIRTHEELTDKDVTGYDFIASAQAGGDGNGRDADYTDAGDGADCGQGFRPSSWHGTHVAGTILASADNGEGIAGVNWYAGLVTARALGKCGGSTSDIMEGSAWMAGAEINGVPTLAAEDRVTVMNLSLGGPAGCSGFEQDVIDFITGQGTVFVAAAGNDGGAVGSPANCGGVISVAAHGPSGNLSSYSSFGTSVEVVAPGGDIINNQTQGVLSSIGPGNSDYGWFQGTSMATPHVTGAISLLQTIDPTLNRASLATLFQETGGTCGGCGTVPTLQLAALVGSLDGAPVDPGPTDPPDPVEPDPTPTDDAYEPNDGFDAAPTVACGAVLNLFLAPGNVDWFKLDVAEGDSFDLSIDGGAQDLDLYVLDGPTNEDVIGSSTSPTGQEQVSMVAPAGVVAIAVVPWETATGPYSLQVSCLPATPDEPEPTDPEPTDPEPTDPEPTDPEPTDPEPTDPEPTDPEPTDPEPTDPVEDDPNGPKGPGEDGEEPGIDDDLPSTGPAADLSRAGGVESGCSQASGSTSAAFLGLLGLLAGLRRRRR